MELLEGEQENRTTKPWMTVTHARKLGGLNRPVDASMEGLVPSRNVDKEEQSSAAVGVYIAPLEYHCVSKLVATGGQRVEPPVL